MEISTPITIISFLGLIAMVYGMRNALREGEARNAFAFGIVLTVLAVRVIADIVGILGEKSTKVAAILTLVLENPLFAPFLLSVLLLVVSLLVLVVYNKRRDARR